MDSIKKIWVSLIVVAIIAIGGCFTPAARATLGAVSSATTFLPSFGLGTLDVGSGCGNQYTNCIPALSISAGTTTQGTIGTPAYYSLGGTDYASVQQSFASSATNTPIHICNPFGTATTTFGFDGMQMQLTSGPAGAWEFDIATTTGSGNATTSNVLVKDQLVSAGAAFDNTYYPGTATTSTAVPGLIAGVLAPVNGFSGSQGSTNWFLRGGVVECVDVRIASTSVTQTAVGSFSTTFKKQ